MVGESHVVTNYYQHSFLFWRCQGGFFGGGLDGRSLVLFLGCVWTWDFWSFSVLHSNWIALLVFLCISGKRRWTNNLSSLWSRPGLGTVSSPLLRLSAERREWVPISEILNPSLSSPIAFAAAPKAVIISSEVTCWILPFFHTAETGVSSSAPG